MEHLTKALKYFLIGILLYPVLINIIGFMSPFLHETLNGDYVGPDAIIFLSFFQPILPFFSLFYLLGAYHLSKTTGIFGKLVLLSSATLLVLHYILNGLVTEGEHQMQIALLSLSRFIFVPTVLYIAYLCSKSSTQVANAV